jgi:hypothetical protein
MSEIRKSLCLLLRAGTLEEYGDFRMISCLFIWLVQEPQNSRIEEESVLACVVEEPYRAYVTSF